MTRTVFLNFFYGLLHHLTKKQPPLSTSQIMGAVLIVFSRGHYIIIAPIQTSFVKSLFSVPSTNPTYVDEER